MKGNKNRILIVDDIPSNLNFICDVLDIAETEILLATNGKDAIDIATQKLPDLILLDIAMPELDGYTACKILKASEVTKDIPIIFLTARSEKQDIIKGFEVGAVDYIHKPFNTTELISRVNTHLDLKYKTEQLKLINQTLEQKVKERTKQLEESNQNLTDTNTKLQKAYKELTKLDKVKSDFILHINHEIRTPLQGIRGFTSILLDTELTNDQKEFLDSINQLVDRLVDVSELSLLFTELKTENYKLNFEEIDIIDCLKGFQKRLDNNEKNISLNISESENKILVKSDQKLLCACIDIILNNALKYSSIGSTIDIILTWDSNSTIIQINDNGPGFSDKALENLFVLLSADNLDQGSYGLGIGMATTKLILDLIGGHIEVSNSLSGGAVVKIFIESNGY